MDRYNRSHFAAATLFANARQHAGHEIASMADLLADLAEIDAHKHYLPAGYESILAYCLAQLPYTEDEAKNRIRAARVAHDYPAVLPMLANGQLHLTGVLRLSHYLTAENADGLLAAAANKRKLELEALLSERFPRSEVFTWTEEVSACEKNHEGVLERVENAAAQSGAIDHRSTAKPLSAQSFGMQFP